MPPIVNQTEIRVIGMSRSGNHAILQWLVAQMAEADRRVCWLNCCEPKWNPYWTARPFDNGAPYWANYPFDLEAEKACRFSPKDFFLFNYEDNYLRNACSEVYDAEHDGWVGPSQRRHDVLILRDPFNLFASRLRSLEPVVSPRVAVKIWKQHAKQFIGPVPRMLRHNPVLILYNRWCTDRAYRQRIAEALGVPFTDAGKARVAAVHGGSSFDGLSFDGRAGQMRTAERWRHYIEDPAYRGLFDAEVLRLSQAIFGDLPAADAMTEASPTERLLRAG